MKSLKNYPSNKKIETKEIFRKIFFKSDQMKL